MKVLESSPLNADRRQVSRCITVFSYLLILARIVLRRQTATVVTAAVASPTVSTTAIATTAAAVASVPCKRSMWKRSLEMPNHQTTTPAKSQKSSELPVNPKKVWKKKGTRRTKSWASILTPTCGQRFMSWTWRLLLGPFHSLCSSLSRRMRQSHC